MAGLLIWLFTVDIQLTFCCGTCEVSTLVRVTTHYICNTVFKFYDIIGLIVK